MISDWSASNYDFIQGIDAESSPGDLIARNSAQQMPLLHSPSPLNGIWAMAVLDGNIYAGAGGYPINEVGADVWKYTVATDTWDLLAQLPEEGILVMKSHGGKLYIPGMDATLLWDRGSLYVYDGQTWVVHQNIPEAVHVFDVEFIGTQMFVSTGQMDNTGAVWRSADGGGSWSRILTLVTSGAVRRVYGLGVFEGKLYAQPDGKNPEGKVVFIWDGAQWETAPLSEISDDQWILFSDEDRFYLSGRGDFYTYDGSEYAYTSLPFSGNRWARAMTLHWETVDSPLTDKALYGGGTSGRVYRSTDRVDWSLWTELGGGDPAGEVESLVSLRGRLYAGTYRTTGPGGVYVSSSTPLGTMVSKPFDVGFRATAAVLDWSAIEPPGTTMKIQVKAAMSEFFLEQAPFLGPDGTSATYFEFGGQALPDALLNKLVYQYKVLVISGDPKLTSVTEWIRLQFYSDLDAAGVGDVSGGDIRLAAFPNPSSGLVHFRLGGLKGPGSVAPEIRLYDLGGRELARLPWSRSGTEVVWDASSSDAAQGTYFYRVTTDGGRSFGFSGRVQILR
jgi:hypothetical protein